MTQTPSIGRIVHYKLTEQDAAATNKRRSDFAAAPPQNSGLAAHIGNSVKAGDVYPAMITRIWGATPESSVQLQVFLDGNDTLWATSVSESEGAEHKERHYIWPPRV